jgi:hypothetical protein
VVRAKLHRHHLFSAPLFVLERIAALVTRRVASLFVLAFLFQQSHERVGWGSPPESLAHYYRRGGLRAGVIFFVFVPPGQTQKAVVGVGVGGVVFGRDFDDDGLLFPLFFPLPFLPFFAFFFEFFLTIFWVEKVPPQIHTTTQGKKRVVRFVVAMRDIITTMTSPRAATNVVVELVVALFGSLLSRFDFDHQKRAYAAHILPGNLRGRKTKTVSSL